jgi:hypothetical protein
LEDWNNITIKHTIAIGARHAHVKNYKKRKYELDDNDRVRKENKNLEDAWLILQLPGIRLKPGAKLEGIDEATNVYKDFHFGVLNSSLIR